jgi:hypothetical protein
MQSQVPTASSTPASFAGFLAALTRPDRTGAETVPTRAPTGAATHAPVWNDELLADDVATLSYEQALRAHARYHADDPVGDPATAEPHTPADAAAPQPEAAVVSGKSAPLKVLKEASITIRLSHEEDMQLRKRAAEAELTVSAYIRSCTFEAEALRALVKDTLTQFRSTATPPQQDANPPNRRRWPSFFWPVRRAIPHHESNQA